METATLFTVGFANRIPVGALLLVSDQPMISEAAEDIPLQTSIKNFQDLKDWQMIVSNLSR